MTSGIGHVKTCESDEGLQPRCSKDQDVTSCTIHIGAQTLNFQHEHTILDLCHVLGIDSQCGELTCA